MTQDDQTLDLTALAPKRRHVRFEEGGDLYEMLHPGELSLAQRGQVAALGNELEKLEQRKAGSDKEERMTVVADKLVRIIIPALTPRHLKRVTMMQKEAAIATFMIAFGSMIGKLTGGLTAIALTETASTPES